MLLFRSSDSNSDGVRNTISNSTNSDSDSDSYSASDSASYSYSYSASTSGGFDRGRWYFDHSDSRKSNTFSNSTDRSELLEK